MENVTVGKYVPGNSLVHNLNPFIKLCINIIFIVLVFISPKIILLGSILLLSILMFGFSGLRLRQLWRMMIPVLVITFFLFLLNLFLIKSGYQSGGTINYKSFGTGYFWNSTHLHWWRFTLSDKAVFQTLIIGMRIYVMIIITTLLTSTTKQTALTHAIEQLLYPLKLFFIPIHIVAMIISIALRFIPTLLDEAQRIMKAQASRGVDFKNGNFKSKAKSMLTLVIPLFVSAFAKAEDLGNAMETRGYDPYEKRTRYRNYPLHWFDLIAVLVIAGIISVIAMTLMHLLPNPVWFI